MAKKIDCDLVIGNGLISLGRSQLTKNQINDYMELVNYYLPEGYYTYCYNDWDAFENFCQGYNFIVKKDKDIMTINTKKIILLLYFRLGVSKELIKVFDESAKIFNEREKNRGDLTKMQATNKKILSKSLFKKI